MVVKSVYLLLCLPLIKLPLIVNADALFSCYMTGQLENCVNEQYTGVPNKLTIVCICIGSFF